MSDIQRVVEAFGAAKSAAEYHGAKRMAGRLSIPSQYKVVDSIISCRRRLEGEGVL